MNKIQFAICLLISAHSIFTNTATGKEMAFISNNPQFELQNKPPNELVRVIVTVERKNLAKAENLLKQEGAILVEPIEEQSMLVTEATPTQIMIALKAIKVINIQMDMPYATH